MSRMFPSPFQYPGGKSRLAYVAVPALARVLAGRAVVEPFVGGGSFALACASLAAPPASLHINDLDDDIATFWRVVFSADAERLASRVESFTPTRDAVLAVAADHAADAVAVAFRALVANRTHYGGVVYSGGRPRDVARRWLGVELARRIRAAAERRALFRVTSLDALDVIASSPPAAFLFVDPPYTACRKSPGAELYRHSALDHARLFDVCAARRAPFLMTYNDCDEVRALAAARGLDVAPFRVLGNTGERRAELLIYRRRVEH